MPSMKGQAFTDQNIKSALAAELDNARPRGDLWPAIEAEALRRQSKPRWCDQVLARLDRLGSRARRLGSKFWWLWPSSDRTPWHSWSWLTIDSAPRIAGTLAVRRRPSLAIGLAVAALATLMFFQPWQGTEMLGQGTLARGLNGYWYEKGQLVVANAATSYGDFFDDKGVNPIVDTHDNFTCKFGVEVDTASYAAARRAVLENALPGSDSVRLESFINSFAHEYKPPTDEAFALYVEGAPSHFGGADTWLLSVGLQARTGDAAEVIATNVGAWMEFNPEVVSQYRQLGYEYQRVADTDLGNSALQGGEIRAGHSVTALFEITLHEGATGVAATAHTRYEDPDTGEVVEIVRGFDRSELATSLAEASPQFQRDTAVAEYAELLRDSYWVQGSSFGDVRELVQRVRPLLPDAPDVAEFADLVSRAEMINLRIDM